MLRLRPLPTSLSGFEPFYLLCTWFQSGRIRPASGSWGSLAAMPFCWIVSMLGGPFLLMAVAATLYVAGIWAIHRYAAHSTHPDPSEIVIDEVIGMLVVWMFIPDSHLGMALAGFVMFRLFDSIKRGPVGWCDKTIKGAHGVIIDDIMAGLMTGLVLLLMIRLFY